MSRRRTYLNAQERKDVAVLRAFSIFLHDKAALWAKLGRSKEKTKYTRMAKTLTEKIITLMTETLEPQEKERVVNDIKKYHVAAYQNEEAMREFERYRKAESVVPVDAEDLKDLSDEVLVVCQICREKDPEKLDSCRLRRILLKYDIPVFNQYSSKGECPYKIPDLGDWGTIIESLYQTLKAKSEGAVQHEPAS